MTAGATYVTVPADRRFVLVNFGWFDLEGQEGAPYVAPPGAELLFRGPHFQGFRPSRYEAWGIPRREQFRRRAYDLAVYRLPSGSR
jgi:hypothetical protein